MQVKELECATVGAYHIRLIDKSQWISKLNQKLQCIPWMKHIEYPTFADINWNNQLKEF